MDTREFHKFPELPTEIRLIIWKLNLHMIELLKWGLVWRTLYSTQLHRRTSKSVKNLVTKLASSTRLSTSETAIHAASVYSSSSFRLGCSPTTHSGVFRLEQWHAPFRNDLVASKIFQPPRLPRWDTRTEGQKKYWKDVWRNLQLLSLDIKYPNGDGKPVFWRARFRMFQDVLLRKLPAIKGLVFESLPKPLRSTPTPS